MLHQLPYTTIRRALLQFYRRYRRDLPWRQTHDPYNIWLSEIMLQQTRVDTVKERYTMFLQRFPTVHHLAQAQEEDVCAAWAGLGYYRRARLLHAAAKVIVEQHQGQLPADVKALRALPGIGPYTAGAIASIAFQLCEPLVDGNVERVLCRLLALEDNPRTPENVRFLWSVARQLVQGRHPGDLNQALMELGATICTPKAAQCGSCPIAQHCAAYQLGTPHAFPMLPAKRAPTPLAMGFVLCPGKQGWWLHRRSMTGLWPGLWEPLSVEQQDDVQALQEKWQLEVVRTLGRVHHALTHRRVEAVVYLGRMTRAYRQRQNCRMFVHPLQAPISTLAQKVLQVGLASLGS